MTETLSPLHEETPPAPVAPRRPLRSPQYSLAGIAGALLAGSASFTPSLLPREWFVQGMVVGLSGAVGYGAGVFVGWLVQAATGWSPTVRTRRRLWVALAALGIPLVASALWLGQGWQEDVHRLAGVPPPDSYAWVRILVVAIALVVALVGAFRLLGWLVQWVTGRLVRLLPHRLAQPVAVLVVLLLLVGLNNGLLWRGMMAAANSGFGAANSATNEGTVRPTVPERSGGPGSLVSWESLGRQGRDFTGLGPTVQELTELSGRPAVQPVRVYVGLRSAESTADRAALAVRELRRAGGLDRSVLVVATATGTGLVDHSAAETVEYLHNGDTAIVAVQYSYLPSFLSLLADGDKAEEAGRELFNQVYDAWAALPEDRRPQLYVTGTSLGVVGSEAAFGGVADIRNRADGAVWAGAPDFAELHSTVGRDREPGTPQWKPVHEDGRTVRFAATPEDLQEPGDSWPRPRVAYLQHGSDPVVFWSPGLAFTKPDWLSEQRAPDVSPDMFWMPVVTFWQVTADLVSTYDIPAGRGHRYGQLYVDAWAAVAPAEGWSEAELDRLRARIRANQLERESVGLASRGG